ncbi:MAG: glutamine synthetase family protein [Thermoproteota archaeon]|nr:glutamine synthetase family protein [Thermoproteota archaeon]
MTRGDESFLNLNPLIQHAGKPPEEFTEDDIVKFVKNKHIKMLNLCHVPEDGRLKTLSFVIHNEKHLRDILEKGQRVDGSSLFSYIDPAESDIYIVPKYRTAFVNPFNIIPTLNIICEYFNEDRRPLEFSPRNILRKAEERLFEKTRISLEAAPELEFYVIFEQEEKPLYLGDAERNYQESAPFAKCETFRNEVLATLARCGLAVKYGHAEVGLVLGDGGVTMEQHEVEFLLQPLEVTADAVTIAKWAIRNIGAKRGMTVSFAPKVRMGHAGNGMHIHIHGLKNGESVMTGANGELAEEAKKMIGGILKFASSLTAFGNTVPISYLRLVPGHEAPVHLCWGHKNRLALVRIPLNRDFQGNLAEKINPHSSTELKNVNRPKQTVELRSPDASANIYLLLAGIAVVIGHGLRNEENLKLADELFVDASAYGRKHKALLTRLKPLPKSCYESAKYLERDRALYEEENIFPKEVVDAVVQKLKSYRDEELGETLKNTDEANKFIEKYLHCG